MSIALKPFCYILLLLLCNSSVFSQYYLRGEIKDEANKPLSNVKIISHSSGYIYYSGVEGGFGIMSARPTDSITLSLDGFQSTSVRLENNKYEYITLKL